MAASSSDAALTPAAADDATDAPVVTAATVEESTCPPEQADTATSQRERRLAYAASHRVAGVHCILENIQDRGNRAAVLRSVEALGLLHVHEVAPARPEQGRARGVAHGGEKWLIMHEYSTPTECRAACKGLILLAALAPVSDVPASPSWHAAGSRRRKRVDEEEHKVEAGGLSCMMQGPPPTPGHLTTPIALECVDFSRPTALVFGNERLGVSAEMLAVCDGAFYIPLHGLTESLNVSVAAAISMHYGRVARVAALRQLGTLNQAGGDLSGIEITELLAEYATRGKHHSKTSTGNLG